MHTKAMREGEWGLPDFWIPGIKWSLPFLLNPFPFISFSPLWVEILVFQLWEEGKYRGKIKIDSLDGEVSIEKKKAVGLYPRTMGVHSSERWGHSSS